MSLLTVQEPLFWTAVATDTQCQQLELWVRAPSTPQSLVKRARIVLLSLSGLTSQAVGQQLKVSQPTIRLWQRRFRDGGPEVLTEIGDRSGPWPQTQVWLAQAATPD